MGLDTGDLIQFIQEHVLRKTDTTKHYSVKLGKTLGACNILYEFTKLEAFKTLEDVASTTQLNIHGMRIHEFERSLETLVPDFMKKDNK